MSLLPDNKTPFEQVIEAVTTSRLATLPVDDISNLWNPWLCPVPALPWLAHALSVDEWSSNWSEAAQRAAIAEAIPVHRFKGTKQAITLALNSLQCSLHYSEWREFGGAPHSARVTALAHDNVTERGDTLLTAELQQQLWRVVSLTKPLRTSVDFQVGVQMSASLHMTTHATSRLHHHASMQSQIDATLHSVTLHTCAAFAATATQATTMHAAPDTQLTAKGFVGVGIAHVTFNYIHMVVR